MPACFKGYVAGRENIKLAYPIAIGEVRAEIDGSARSDERLRAGDLKRTAGASGDVRDLITRPVDVFIVHPPNAT